MIPTLDNPYRRDSWRNGMVTLIFGVDDASVYGILPAARPYRWKLIRFDPFAELGRYHRRERAEAAARAAEVWRLESLAIPESSHESSP